MAFNESMIQVTALFYAYSLTYPFELSFVFFGSFLGITVPTFKQFLIGNVIEVIFAVHIRYDVELVPIEPGKEVSERW